MQYSETLPAHGRSPAAGRAGRPTCPAVQDPARPALRPEEGHEACARQLPEVPEEGGEGGVAVARGQVVVVVEDGDGDAGYAYEAEGEVDQVS